MSKNPNPWAVPDNTPTQRAPFGPEPATQKPPPATVVPTPGATTSKHPGHTQTTVALIPTPGHDN